MEEDAQQQITFLLQEIDANICAAHRSATQICATVRKHHQILRQIHEASQVWRPLFESFAVQPAAARRPAVTPAPPTASKRRDVASPPGSAESNELDNTQRNLSFSDDDNDNDVVEEQTFKTTTLKKLASESVDESMNVSLASEHLPAMARTPYMHKTRGHPGHSEGVSVISEHTSNWTPALSSPPRTDILKVQARAAAQPLTPPSAISSIHPSSPNVSRDLMKMGAFEFSPPAKPGQPQASSVSGNGSPRSPRMPRFSVSAAYETAGMDGEEEQKESSLSSPSQRKRKRPGSPMRSPPPRQEHGTPGRRGSPSTTLSTPGSFASLRRKYSEPEYSTPKRSRRIDPNPKTVESIKKASEELLKHDDSPSTPTFEMPSPLLRTQLKAMTPHTPLSNRLVGANLDVGSTNQESRIHEYDESFEAGDPTPQFQLSLFPSAFQRGIGAVQMTALYSRFQSSGSGDKPALSVEQLAEALPDYGKERIEILLDTLVSRRLLRPFVVEGTMFWQIPV